MSEIPVSKLPPHEAADALLSQTQSESFRFPSRRGVEIVDSIAKYVICTGGISVTLAFAGIVIFIFSVVVPLFGDAKLTTISSVELESSGKGKPAVPPKRLAMGIDESLGSLWVVESNGNVSTYRTAGGQRVATQSITKQPITAVSHNNGDVAIGTADGSVRVGRITHSLEYLPPKSVPDSLESLLPGQTAAFGGGVVSLVRSNQVAIVKTAIDLSDPIKLGDKPSPILLVDYLFSDRLEAFTALREDGRLMFNTITKKENVMTGKVKRDVQTHELPVPESLQKKVPAALLLGLNGRMVFVLYQDGTLLRCKTDDPDHLQAVEVVKLLAGENIQVTSVRMLLGNLTLIVADSKGGLSGWFPAPLTDGDLQPSDGVHMVKAHVLEKQSSEVTAIGTSALDRRFVTCDSKGELLVRHMTSGTTQGKMELGGSAPISLVAIAPKNDAVTSVDASGKLTLLRLENPHPDGSMSQLFGKIWYEGYPKPDYVYQSSAGTDDAESKFSLIPLIFGTIKATFYALLFGVPIAILAAIYTSEFTDPKIKSVIKPFIEMMASIPSVVLGFLAALVLAPIVENAVMAVLATFIAVPIALATFGGIWQLTPTRYTRRVSGLSRFAILIVLVVLALVVTFTLGPAFERLLFAGDFKGWLAGRIGTATPGWIIFLTPILYFAQSFLFHRQLRLRFEELLSNKSAAWHNAADFLRPFVMVIISIALAAILGQVLAKFGWDLRGNVVGGYVQRNTLIVGMIMGFAIIPIVYSISEDALSSVPNSLRAAALGAGATPWQTAIRVVMPVATSGIFSACMIGLGRAAGETMIVLMASGRTPIMDLNIFNGLSALSANIATELPEAAVNSTHYRILFMSALVLFLLTFAVNTTAEVIRLRFRKRAFNL